MRKAIVFAASVALLAPILCAQRQETGLVIQSWKYDPDTKGLELKLVNLSGKDYRPQHRFFSKKGAARDHLKEYVEDSNKQITLTAPHCELKKLNMSR